MSIIAITGLNGSGKSTVANMIAKASDCEIASFADSLKDAVALIFGWERDLLSGDTIESREWREKRDDYWHEALKDDIKELSSVDLTPRFILQYIGVNILRDRFSDSIWINSLRKKILCKNVVIADCRFRNEIDMVKAVGGYIIRVERGDMPKCLQYYEDMYKQMPNAKSIINESSFCPHEKEKVLKYHHSEWDWLGYDRPFFTIHNNGTLEDLKQQVDDVLELIATKTP